ncbi:MAG: hypothetical protein WC673_01775 [Candidatus Paceibacterota bacterium]|jgi:hypothetical protein
MKKTAIKSIVAMFIAFTIIAFSAYAQDPPNPPTSGGSGGGGSSPVITALPMIQSQDALRNYALDIARFGTRSVNAPTLDWNWVGNINYTNATGAYGEQILDKLFNAEFVYRLTNPEDKISGYVYLYDAKFGNDNNPNMLFFGNASYTLADLKVSKPQYNIWMQSIPLPLSNVSSAEVLALDEDGKTARRESLDINNGQPKLNPWFAGAPNGILAVKFQDGSLVTYDLASPTGEVPVGSHESAAWKVDGHYVYKTGEKPTRVKIIETWQRPSVLLEATAPQYIVIDVLGIVQMDGKTIFERPVSMEVTRQDSGETATVVLNNEMTDPPKVLFPAGQFRIRFNWTNFGKPNNIYTGPTDGGKG